MKAIYKPLQTLLLLTAALLTCASCSDDGESILSSLFGSSLQVTDKTVSSLTFSWEGVENASQYGYRLIDPDGEAVTGNVTTNKQVTITGLDDDTEYTFELTSFAAYDNGTYKNADPVTLTARTEKIMPLDTPSPAGEVMSERLDITWDEIENADRYYVKVTASDGTETNDTVTSAKYIFTGEVGLTYAVSVSADTDAEAYSQSEWGTVENLVPVKSERKEIWRVEGSFEDNGVTGETLTRTLVAYDDGTYALLDWIKEGSGYNLEFAVNSSGGMDILNSTGATTGYIPVAYDNGSTCYVYVEDGYSKYNADKCYFWFYAYGSTQGYSEFTWNADDVVYATSEAKEIWRVEGSFYDAAVYNATYTRTLVAYSDGTYELLDWVYGGSGCNLQFSVNDSGEMVILNGGDLKSGYTPVDYYPGGYVCYLYTENGYSKFNAEKGNFWFYAYCETSGYSEFTWDPANIVYAQ